MALVDTSPLTIAVDRSLFGPQGRRWIERKLPTVVTNCVFAVVAGFGSCLIMLNVTRDFKMGLVSGVTALPKHITSVVILLVVARILHWHVCNTVQRCNTAVGPEDRAPQFIGLGSSRLRWAPWSSRRRKSMIGTPVHRTSGCDSDDDSNSLAGTFFSPIKGISSMSQVFPDPNVEPALEKPLLDDMTKESLSVNKATRAKARRRSPSAPQLIPITEDSAHLLLHMPFVLKMVDDGSWIYVEDEQYYHKEYMGLGWALGLFQKGWKIGVRYHEEVPSLETHRMLFQCERTNIPGHVHIRSRATNTLLFTLGVKRPRTLVAWDREAVGGDSEDAKIEFLRAEGDKGQVIIHFKACEGWLVWTGARFIHSSNKEQATRFVLQCVDLPNDERVSME